MFVPEIYVRGCAAVQQIADWLEKLGMSEYAACFAENKIDTAVLRYLSDQDLKDMGVPLGHRRKMLAAIAGIGHRSFDDDSAAAPFSVPATMPSADAIAAAKPTTDAAGERRYLTVMFCDLVGSTGISAQLDAEEWRDLVGSYLDAASAAVTEMGGQVAKKLGDGLLALFGYPLAQENDAERAVRAALAIQRALAELNRKNASTGKPELIARIGLDTGPAVVDATGEIYGDVANVAARVQALAEPGAVLVAARVQRQVAGLFVAEEHGSHVLKGVPEPVVLYRLIRASGGGRRSGQRQLTPLVGRDEEMAMLMRRWDRARQGDGQFVLIVGEPGLGKSRLLEEFHSRLRDTPHTWTEWSFLQLLQNTPLHSIAEWGRQRFGGADVPAERRLADLESSLSLVKLDPGENIPLLAPLLDIPLLQDRAPTLTAEELRRRQLAALTDWSLASARIQPLVLALEDLHWADPTSLELLRGIAERGALAPLLVVATTRPEFRPAWGVRSHHITISLAPLDRQQVREMVAELSARHALANEVVEDVAARTGGVPLFIEEVTRLLLERGEQGGIQAIPPTLQQSLMARLDRLGPAREVAQIGSVIGRGFSYSLLRDVAGMEDAALQAALEKLAEADIVLVQGLPPGSDYRFKHALIQDAAYENLLKSRRQVLHRRVAEMLRDRFADTAAREPEALAHHFTQAGMTDAAIEWWGKAGDQALRRSAFQEAISHLGKAIEMADKVGDSAPRAATPSGSASKRLKLQTSYGRAVAWSRGFGAEETKIAFGRAQELSEDVENIDERFATYYGVWVGHFLRGEHRLALETAEAFRREAENAGRITETVVARRWLGLTYLYLGDFAELQAHLRQALSTYNPERDRDARYRYGVDTSAAARAYLAHTNWVLGELVIAGSCLKSDRRLRSNPVMSRLIVTTYQHIGLLRNTPWQCCCHPRISKTMSNSPRTRDRAFAHPQRSLLNAWARARLGDRETGMTELQQTLATYRGTGKQEHSYHFTKVCSPNSKSKGKGRKRALARIDEALALANETGEHWSDAFLHRIRGEILLKRDPVEHGACGGSIPHRRRDRATTKGAEFRAARGALAGKALSIDRASRRRPRRACVSARRLCADAGVSADRGSAGAPRGACRNRRGKDRRGSAPTPAQTSDRLWLGGGLVQRFCC